MTGEIMALGCAVSWAGSVICMRRAKEALDPLAVNTFRTGFALALILPTWWFVEEYEHPVASAQDIGILLLSGALGIGVADALFVATLRRLGAARTAVIECLYSPSVVAMALVFLGEELTVRQWFGGSLVVGSVLWAHAQAPTEGVTARDLHVGLALGSLSLVTMAGGIVMAKPLLGAVPLMWAVMVRLGAGFGLSLILLLVRGLARRGDLRSASLLYRHRDFSWIVASSFLGTYVSMIFWVGGFKFGQASVAAVINQLSTVFTIGLAAVFLNERISRSLAAAAVLAVVGVLLVSVPDY